MIERYVEWISDDTNHITTKGMVYKVHNYYPIEQYYEIYIGNKIRTAHESNFIISTKERYDIQQKDIALKRIEKVIYDYQNINIECWTGLIKGTNVICKKDVVESSVDGLHETFLRILSKDSIYEVSYLDNDIAYVIDNYSNRFPVKTEIFELNKFDKRKYISQKIG